MGRFSAFILVVSAGLVAGSAGATAIEPAVRTPSALPAALTRSDAVEPGHRRQGAAHSERCRRWLAVADRLGETYAGHRLRSTVVARSCALAGMETHEEELWQWPWRNGDVRGELPPRLHGSIGAWVIRCGRAGKRQRCAMLHDWLPSAQPGRALRIVSHFVIDTIGGRESVLWRVLVSGTDASRDRIELSIGEHRVTKSFLACGKPGCQMEADLRLSAKAANRLWDGSPIVVSLIRDGRSEHSWRMSGQGFREALSELARLRREEGRALAGRR